jgi:LuxR family maltose regulon positive regulatory protein
VLQLLGEHPQPSGCDAYLGMARLYYEWNDLASAEQYGQKSLQLAKQYDSVIDRFIICEVFLARLKLAQRDVPGATTILTEASQSARQYNFVHRLPEIAAAQIQVMLYQGNLTAAAQLAEGYELPLIQARLHIAQGKPAAALAILEPLRQKMETLAWQDERLKVMILQVLALYAHSETDQAIQILGEALRIAEADGFVRIFIDGGIANGGPLIAGRGAGSDGRVCP